MGARGNVCGEGGGAKYFFFGAEMPTKFVNLQNNRFTKQIPSQVLLQTGTNLWQQHDRKCSGGINFVIITKIITNILVPRNYFVIASARMVRRFMSKFLGVSFLTSASKKRMCLGAWPWYLVQTPFVTLLFRTLRAFRKGISEKAFHVEVPWSVPSLFRSQKGTYLGTRGMYHLKLLF